MSNKRAPDHYCGRCDKSITGMYNIQAHKHFSPNHWPCPACPFDGYSRADVLGHWDKGGCRKICWGCNNGEGEGFTRTQYDHHMKLHNVCIACHQHFEDPESLEQHQVVHLVSDIECHGCSEIFPTYAAMISHLQAGICKMQIPSRELHRTIAMVYRWKQLVRPNDKDSRNDFLDEIELTDRYCYRAGNLLCPGCDSYMAEVRDLYRHVKNRHCGQRWDSATIERLVNWMENRYYYKIPVTKAEFEQAGLKY